MLALHHGDQPLVNSFFIFKTERGGEFSSKHLEYSFFLLVLGVVLETVNVLIKDSKSQHGESMLHLCIVKVDIVASMVSLIKDGFLYVLKLIICVEDEGDGVTQSVERVFHLRHKSIFP